MKALSLNQKGQGAVEYGLVALVIVLVVVAVMQPQITTALTTVWTRIQANMPGA